MRISNPLCIDCFRVYVADDQHNKSLVMKFKRRTHEQIREHFRRAGERAEANALAEQHHQEQRQADLAAMLRGAMVVGGHYAQKSPGTFSTSVHKRLSDPLEPPSADLLKLLRHLGEA